MATPNRPHTSQRPSRAQSILSDTSFNSPRPTPPPPPTRRGHGVRAASTISDAPSALSLNTPEKAAQKATAAKLSAHYYLAPTFPSPFTGTLNASLDAIQDWSRIHGGTKGVQGIVDTLLREVDCTTDWPALLRGIEDVPAGQLRYVVEELLFLVTRTLLPEQIRQNRMLMARLYERKKQLAMRLVLRYDMLREWKMEQGTHHRDQAVAVASVPPMKGVSELPVVPVSSTDKFPYRRAKLPNIIATLVAAPVGGFTTFGVRERMKHHVTDLDEYLLLEDGEVAGWGGVTLVARVCQIVLHWQWLRQNNEMLDDMEVHGWEDLEGKADESEWIADDVKRNTVAVGTKRAREKEDE
jgi:hypothetical protein